jgi:hypothetical protein
MGFLSSRAKTQLPTNSLYVLRWRVLRWRGEVVNFRRVAVNQTGLASLNDIVLYAPGFNHFVFLFVPNRVYVMIFSGNEGVGFGDKPWHEGNNLLRGVFGATPEVTCSCFNAKMQSPRPHNRDLLHRRRIALDPHRTNYKTRRGDVRVRGPHLRMRFLNRSITISSVAIRGPRARSSSSTAGGSPRASRLASRMISASDLARNDGR